MTDSRVLAMTVGKRHGNVLRAYDGLESSAELSRLNFEPREFLDKRGKTQRFVKMTKDGFTMLTHGFTGPSAMAFEEVYIAAFNEVADHGF